jgi:hypothetical protein
MGNSKKHCLARSSNYDGVSTEPVSKNDMETDMMDACSSTLRSDQFTLVRDDDQSRQDKF